MSDENEPPIYEKDIFDAPLIPAAVGRLRQQFMFPPFTVINTREGSWMGRKKKWLQLGIRSEMGRGNNPAGHGPTTADKSFYAHKRQLEDELGRVLSTEEATEIIIARGDAPDRGRKNSKGRANTQGGGHGIGYNRGTKGTGNQVSDKYSRGGLTYGIGTGGNAENGWQGDEKDYGTSHFDPVLCEIGYNWFCAPDGLILDPFSGCSVSGMIAAYTRRRFWGCDLSLSQVRNNRKVLKTLPDEFPKPTWVHGDSRDTLPTAPACDLLWSCPPYFDLEVYSDNPNDISTMDWDDFRDAYYDILVKACGRLRDDRFAAITIGDVRDKEGAYRGLPAFTTFCMKKAGLRLYNEMLLVTAVGSLSVRTPRQFTASRKLGCTHQWVLVYVKGDPKKATDYVTGMPYQERMDKYDADVAARTKAISAMEE